MSIVLIEGWGGSGKSLLLSYLDSHSEIIAMPVHDKIPYDVAKLDSSNFIVNDQDIRKLRSILSSHGYYNIEYNAIRKVIPVLLSTNKDDIINIPFKINFEAFESLWKSYVAKAKNMTKDELVEYFYKAFAESVEFKENKIFNNLKYYATLGDARSYLPNEILEKFNDLKIIFVKRSIPDIIAIRSNRNTPTGLTKGMFEKDFLEVIFSGEINKIINYERSIQKAIISKNDRVLNVDFDELLSNKNETLFKIISFLNCQQETLSPKLLGYDIGDGDKNYGSNKNDSAEELLSKTQLRIVIFLERAGRLSSILNKGIFALMRTFYIIYRIFRRIYNLFKK